MTQKTKKHEIRYDTTYYLYGQPVLRQEADDVDETIPT